jgi:hypothetical protein
MTSTLLMKAHQAKLISTGNGRAPDSLCCIAVLYLMDGVISLLMETGQCHAFLGLELSVRFGGRIQLTTLLDFRCCIAEWNPPS